MKKVTASIIMALLVAASCNKPAIDYKPEDNKLLIKSFALEVEGLKYRAKIDSETKTLTIGSIEFGGYVTGVDYTLEEGATISPDPAKYVSDWPSNCIFEVTSADGARTEIYTLILSKYIAQYPSHSGETIFFDDFDQDGTKPDDKSWRLIFAGTAAWQQTQAGDYDHVQVMEDEGVTFLRCICDKSYGVYKSGSVSTQSKAWFGPGTRIEVRARFTRNVQGGGAAIWLMPEPKYQVYTGWPQGGELDIMEHSDHNTYYQHTVHSNYIDIVNQTGEGKVKYNGCEEGVWAVYAMDLTDEAIVYYYNGKEMMRYNNMHLENETEVMQWPFSGSYYLILSTSLKPNSRTISDEELPLQFDVDWVKATYL